MLAGAINRIHRAGKRKGHGVGGGRRETGQRVKVKREILRRAALAQENGSYGVGIGLKATLKARKLLIPLNVKNAKNTEVAQVRYTPRTQQGEPSTTRSMPQQMCEKLWTLSRTRRALC